MGSFGRPRQLFGIGKKCLISSVLWRSASVTHGFTPRRIGLLASRSGIILPPGQGANGFMDRALPAICHQGRCLTCAARLIAGEVDQSAAASYFDQDRAAGFALLCTARPRSNLVLQTHQQWEMRLSRHGNHDYW